MEFDINSPSPKWIHPITDHHSVYTLSASSNEASMKCSHNIEFIGHRYAFNCSNDATPIDEFTFSILEWIVFVIHFNWIREITHAHSTHIGWYAIECMFNTIVIRLITNFYCDVRCIRIDFDSFQTLSSLFSSITGSLPECVTPAMTTGDVKVGKFHESATCPFWFVVSIQYANAQKLETSDRRTSGCAHWIWTTIVAAWLRWVPATLLQLLFSVFLRTRHRLKCFSSALRYIRPHSQNE